MWMSLWVCFQTLPNIILQNQTQIYVVVDRRDTWMIVRNGDGRYFVETVIDDPYQWGDFLVLSVNIRPLAFTTYEGKFNFVSYLNERGVTQQLTIVKSRIVFAFPIRTRRIIDHRLNQLQPETSHLVSLLLFNRSRGEGQPSILQELFTMSGLGFYLLWSVLLKCFMIRFDEHQSRFILLGFFLPYLILSIGHWSFLRIYLLETLRWTFKSKGIQPIKGYGLAFFSMINPYYWIQPGGKIYLAFQAFILFILPLLQMKKRLGRWLAFSSMSFLWEWMNEGTISIIQTMLFAPMAMIQIWFIPGWVIYLYFGIEIPLLAWLTKRISEMILYIPNLSPIYLGLLNPWLMWMLLIFIFLWLWFQWLKLTIHKHHVLMMGLILLTVHMSNLDQRFVSYVDFLNVGQGDATLVYSHGQSLLIDTGGVKQFDIAKEVLIPYLRKQRIRHLDYLIITHNDFDHNGGLESLLKHFHVKNLIMATFQPFKLGRMVITNYQQYWPSLIEDNERSLMVGIEAVDCRWLVMGDATIKTEALLLSDFPNLKANVLRIGHHGSNTSTSDDLLNQLQVKHAVISSGGGNRYGHPHPEVMERLNARDIQIRRTDLEGTIRYQTCKI